jgi:hypothetical protein
LGECGIVHIKKCSRAKVAQQGIPFCRVQDVVCV